MTLRQEPITAGAAVLDRKILFVAVTKIDIASILREPLADFEVVRTNGTAETLAAVVAGQFSHVVVDLSAGDLALQLLVPLLSGSDHDYKLYIIANDADVSTYLRMQGVDRVFTPAAAERQIRHALASTRSRATANVQTETNIATAHASEPAPAVSHETVISPLVALRNRATNIVSGLYKNTAFVLLAVLFSAFCFYGMLIGYFLVSSGWGAPVTLSQGHELVSKVEQQLNDMRVNANLTKQRYSEAQLEASDAERARNDADVLVGYMASTIDGELTAREARRKTMVVTLKRLKKLKANFESQLGKTGISKQLDELYRKRIIDKAARDSNTLGILEASQRLSSIEEQLATADDDVAVADASIAMLKGLKQRLVDGKTTVSMAASADLILLTKQAMDARSALDQSEVKLQSARARLRLLDDSSALLRKRIAEVEQSALGRAVTGRVDVIFVPYGNESGFKPGTPLYSCALTFIICHYAGETGIRVPGEANAVHPFFGKPIRGYFVEAILTDKEAASQEIIHGKRAPLFF